jgi:hypothetical protein
MAQIYPFWGKGLSAEARLIFSGRFGRLGMEKGLSNLGKKPLKERLTLLVLSIGLAFCWVLLNTSEIRAIPKDLSAEGKSNSMPIRWDQAFPRIIPLPDPNKLQKGEILCEINKVDSQTLVAQSVGLIKAKAEECFKVVRDYNQYIKLMPYTVENKVVRSFQLEGDYLGAEAVDIWTRIKVFGFNTHYLLRIAHLPDPQEGYPALL